MRTIDTKNQETSKTLQQAFSDVNALKEKAKDIVNIAEKINAKLQQEKSGENSQEESELRSMLISIGIASPVTKYVFFVYFFF